ncbi:chromosome partitioning protein ParB [Photobacterium frigidiphilum]|uniref:Chromosome partitioning protein ParB n=1 Tax=Photobacterium frigidiphilum TaxID=264736 RepID=A0A2T3J7U9_9GAMM|nr:ParB/RepB/Spo0J family partition protein [Photobacterium frigidiphilum]PSU44841.1 chromosome partitioning protein ParB [Photobacterium frigidiphilum]
MSLRDRAAGIDLLDESNVELREGEKILKIPVSEIYSESQVRKYFPIEKIKDLGASIKEHGQIQPIVVYPMDGKGYKIQKGECRWRGAKLHEISHLDAIVRTTGTMFQQLAENIHRIDLDPFEVGAALLLMKKEEGLNNKQLAKKMTISESEISAFLKTVSAPEFVVKAYYDDQIGDKETVNSLRIAASMNEEMTKNLLANEVTRQGAQLLVKKLKVETINVSSRGKKKSKARDASQPRTNETHINQPKAIRVSLSDGRQGLIDTHGEADIGYLSIIIDKCSEAVILPVTDVNLIGYGN